jgi:hypothetical protein
MEKYLIFNETDGIYASPEEFTNEEADEFIKNFPERFERQGYYKTGDGRRIDPNQVVLIKKLFTGIEE